MGKQYYYDKQYSKALEALHKAYVYAHHIGARELICDNYEYSSMVYAAIGDYAQAYKYLEKMQHLKMCIRDRAKTNVIHKNKANNLKSKLAIYINKLV